MFAAQIGGTHVAPDRPIYLLDEASIDELAKLVREGASQDARIAALAYALAKNLSWRDIHEELRKRDAHPPSHSWLFRLAKIWGWWVVKCQYHPDEVFRYPRTKLYLMAAARSDDLEFLRSRLDMNDTLFAHELRQKTGDVPSAMSVKISKAAYDELVAQTERLSMLTGHILKPGAVLEFLITILPYMGDSAIMELWRLTHGEAVQEPAE